MEAHDSLCRCRVCESILCSSNVQEVPPLQHCCIDPLNLWKALPPTSKFMEMAAKHPTDSDSYNSAVESETSLSSGFVSEHDEGIPAAHEGWVAKSFPLTARALKRAKIGTFVKRKKSTAPTSD